MSPYDACRTKEREAEKGEKGRKLFFIEICEEIYVKEKTKLENHYFVTIYVIMIQRRHFLNGWQNFVKDCWWTG